MPRRRVIGDMNLVKSQDPVGSGNLALVCMDDILRNETVCDEGEIRMPREVDHIRWDQVEEPPGGRVLVQKQRRTRLGSTSNRFVDHSPWVSITASPV